MKLAYSVFSNAIEYYERRGYMFVDVPWLVDRQFKALTSPAGVELDYTLEDDGRSLPASGEQNLLEYVATADEALGSIMCITPCFRHEQHYDELRKENFLKLELMHYVRGLETVGWPLWEKNLRCTIDDAKAFFKSHLLHGTIDEIETHEVSSYKSYDLNLGEIELGSYGFRSTNLPRTGTLVRWIYGTGLAEPRFSTALNKHHGIS